MENVTVSTSHVVLKTAGVPLVDVNVDIKAVPVVRNVVLVTMISIVFNHVMGV